MSLSAWVSVRVSLSVCPSMRLCVSRCVSVRISIDLNRYGTKHVKAADVLVLDVLVD